MIIVVIALIIQIVSTVWVVRDVQKRDMNPWLWGVLTLCATLITVVVYLWVRKPIQGTTPDVDSFNEKEKF